MSAPNRQHILTPLVENETSKTASSSVSSRLEVNKQLTSCLTGSKQRSSRAVSLEPRSLSSYKHNTLGVGATISNAVPSSTIPQWAKTQEKINLAGPIIAPLFGSKVKIQVFYKIFFFEWRKFGYFFPRFSLLYISRPHTSASRTSVGKSSYNNSNTSTSSRFSNTSTNLRKWTNSNNFSTHRRNSSYSSGMHHSISGRFTWIKNVN